MSKGIQWLKEEIEEDIESWGGGNPDYFRGASDAYENVKDWLNQLDEPERIEETTHLLESVLKENKRLGKLLEEKHEEWFELMDEINNQETLSEYWIEQKSIDTHVDTLSGEVQMTFRLDDLENLLVPKQELPVIPKFVADFIERTKPMKSLRVAFILIEERKEQDHEDKLAFWIEEGNSEVFARAWLDGYTVEKEQKYILSINITDKVSKTNYETFLNKRGIFHSMENESFNSEEFNWSEEEIKDLENGEILFEHFTVKVEELEE